MMTVEEAITGRRSIRAFLPKPVPRELIERVLQIAGRAPSGSNVQPWRVWVLEEEEGLGVAEPSSVAVAHSRRHSTSCSRVTQPRSMQAFPTMESKASDTR